MQPNGPLTRREGRENAQIQTEGGACSLPLGGDAAASLSASTYRKRNLGTARLFAFIGFGSSGKEREGSVFPLMFRDPIGFSFILISQC